MSAALRALRDAGRWWWTLLVRVSRLDVEQRLILVKTLDALESPAFPHAKTSVRETARILGFRNPLMWKGLSQHMKADVDHAENVYRHMEACARTRAKHGQPLTNPEVNLLTELAYVGFGILRK